MQLMPGETQLARFASVTLTSNRVQLEVNQWGSRKVTTIALDDLTSSDIESHSKPKWLLLGFLVGLIGLLLQSGAVAAVGLPFFLAWFFTRRKTMVLRSASEKIECAAPFGKWTELQEFIHKIQTAKANRALGPSNQQEVRPMLTEVGVMTTPGVQSPKPAETAFTSADRTAVAPVRATFWTAPPSFTFDSGAVSAAAGAAAPRHSAPLSASAVPAQIERENRQQPQQTSTGLKLLTSREKSSEEIASDVSEKTSPAVICAQERDPRVPDAENTPTSIRNAEAGDISVATERSAVPTSETPSTNVTVPVSTPKRYSAVTLAVCIGVSVTIAVTAAVLFISRSETSSQSAAVAGSVAANDEKAIKSAINVWVRSFRDKDGTTHAACYAPVVEKYFRRYDVSNQKLLRDKENAFAAMELVRTYDISDIQVAAEPGGRIAATFHKDWDTSTKDGKVFAGSEIEKLTFAPYSGAWKIVREEELKILRVSRTPAPQIDSAN